jgi:hypothetical protein
MIEYSKNDVLSVAKNKYDIDYFLFDSLQIKGSKDNLTEGIPFNVVSPDNIESALSSFAGKNGGRQIQMMYKDFKSYYALGVTTNHQGIFIYYNLNLSKDVEIASTIGSSAYFLDTLPNEINKNLFNDIEDSYMKGFLNNRFDGFKYTNAKFNDRLTYDITNNSNRLYGFESGKIEFYKLNNNIFFDLYDDRLFYSSNPKYETFIKNYNEEEYFNIDYKLDEEKKVLDISLSFKDEYQFLEDNLYSYLGIRVSQGYYSEGKYVEFEWTKDFINKTEYQYRINANEYIGSFNEELLQVKIIDAYFLYEKIV